MSNPNTNKRSFGCLPYGCLIAVVLTLLFAGGLTLFICYSIRSAVVFYTTDTKAVIRAVQLDPSTAQAASTKAAQFSSDLDAGRAGELTLSSDEVGALISSTGWADRLAVEIKGDVAEADFSFPLSALNFGGIAQVIIGDNKDRFVTGQGKFRLLIDRGQIKFSLLSLTLNGKVHHEDALKAGQEWMSGFIDRLENTLKRIERLQLTDGKVLLKLGAATK